MNARGLLLEWLHHITIEHGQFEESIGALKVEQSEEREEGRALRPEDRAIEFVDLMRKDDVRGELQHNE
jgi:hypothetical protein